MSVVGPLPKKGMIASWRGLSIGIVFNDSDTENESLDIGRIVGGGWIVDASLQIQSDGSWASNELKAGGEGNLLFGDHIAHDQWENGLIPVIGAFLARLYGIDPNADVPVQNSEVWSSLRFNSGLYQYLTLRDDPGLPYPVPVFKPFTGAGA